MVLASLLLGAAAFGSIGCASGAVDYIPRTAERHAPLDTSDVEVYTTGAPDWDYTLVGSFQERSRGTMPGGRPGLAALLRERGAEHGCDAVILGGNVSRFSGEYRRRSTMSWWARRGDRRQSGPEWVPVFEDFGTNAGCVVRADRTASTLPPGFGRWTAP